MLLGAVVPFVVWVGGVFDNVKNKGMEVVSLIAFIPWALVLLPVHQYYNWEMTDRGDRMAKRILILQVILIIIQLSCAIILVYDS